MATARDVAAYILRQRGPMTAMKLQKLVYYSQAWHLVWDEQPLFGESIEAWANGPVVPELYRAHRGNFRLDAAFDIGGDPDRLTPEQRDTIHAVLDAYGDKSAHWLSELTHREAPWRDTRGDLDDLQRSNAVITTDSMFEYYDALTEENADDV
ncbi:MULTISPECIES: Panacea domain-containing protein [Actinopolyspora]|uniref:Uncharacterized phage-associated protein n=1 Tax=Actinopolyspora saharensis TaxID=995062 RepID=A0A1H1ENG6_9ACTN|nr:MULTISPECIES: type II toxin-antitoxin system antitoxin SocA domain-containing protein [Actinopolyspora]NHD18155.1 DUF4065 domain-containing protein [Actinopolyspora sp. BKK2]NHE77168.1 DUF4065 domain-containing protein [Actinopolyspora sp. BKK1]SDQ90287.1 Uncharacterized phage-associated protein [Actinopolyspora saharensis]